MLKNLGLAKRIAGGVRAKLDLDYACNRGHSFGEYHVHGVVNEILCSNIDPTKFLVSSGFAPTKIQTVGAKGRFREVDFAITNLETSSQEFYAEVKWAGSSHCNHERILQDLCRLQIIKSAEPTAECVFVIAGSSSSIDALFRVGILKAGTQCLLHRPGENGFINSRNSRQRIKKFLINGNKDHAKEIQKICENIKNNLPSIPHTINTTLNYSVRSAPNEGRFQTLVWSVKY